jgi:amino acid transporter
VLGLDALASASYGPEAALTVLLALGVLAPGYIAAISLCIVGVLLATFFSYRQTIAAYPRGGGSFTVAKENLGRLPGLLAASALLIDYVLNAAVAISAGVGALVSVVPALLPHTLWLCLGILALLALVNMRGIRTAGLVFMLPTYLFVGCLGVTIIVGVAKTVLAGGHPVPVIAPPKVETTTRAASAWLLLRAFASGCTALTGVEAVSNAVSIFRQPTIVLARRTLTFIIATLAFLLLGIAFLSHRYGVGATHPGQAGYQSVISQIVAAVTGRGPFYYVTMTAVLMVLAMSANTSFAGFPRVCRALALDEYLPGQFAHRGSRLVYSAGIVALTLLAGSLLVAFGGITDRLIPLFAIGAFSAFTLSQLGMVVHWRRMDGPHARRSLILNAVGALATGSTLIVIALSKFAEGAWITILVVPPLVMMFLHIHRRHDKIERETDQDGPLEFGGLSPPLIVIPLKRLDRVARKALRLALSLSPDVRVVQIRAGDMGTEDLAHAWGDRVERPAREAGYPPPVLDVVRSAYREFYRPMLAFVRRLSAEHPDRPIAVMVPEIVERHWYQPLYSHRATLLKWLLLLRGGPRIVVMTIPWYVHEAHRT